MMKNKKLILIAMVVMLLCIGGCQKSSTTTTDTTETESDDSTEGTHTITDMAGRSVEIKNNITTAFATNPISNIILYTIDSSMLVGLNWAPTDAEKEYLDEDYLNLPVLGGWYGNGNKGNVEEILKVHPDVIIYAGAISQSTIDFSDKLQSQIGIPVVDVDFSIDKMADAYDFLGDILNKKDRTDELSAYITDVYKDVSSKKAKITDSDKVTVYYAEGPSGLQTDPEGSIHSAIISYVGGDNIADVDITQGYGRTTVSAEQLIKWNPDVILVCPETEDSSAYDDLKTNNLYQTISAVKTGSIYEIPDRPFNWFDRPPSANHIIGIKWTANILYPDIYNYDMKSETKKFYKLFYNYTLSDEQVEQLLDKSTAE